MSDHHSLEGIAPLLDLLDLESSERLIGLSREERRRVLARFDRRARELSLRGTLPVPARVYSRLLRLGEEVLEPQGQFAEAVVLYALAQDDCLEGEDDLTGLRVLFRFKLGHVLDLLDDGNEADLERCVDFVCRTIAELKELREARRIESSAFHSLRYKLQHRLALFYEELGRERLAFEAYLAAWSEADEPYDRIDCVLGAASLYEKLGEDQQAFQWLQQCCEDLKEVEDEEIRQLWGALLRKSAGETGRQPDVSCEEFKNTDGSDGCREHEA